MVTEWKQNTESAGTLRVDPPSSSDSHFSLAHTTELDIQRRLLTEADCKFHSLVVHRFRDGICLQGVVNGNAEEAKKICRIAEEVAGVGKIINRLIFQDSGCSQIPPKG